MWTDGKSRHGAPLWSWDGTRVVWSQNARNGRDEDLWTADADGRNAKLWLELEGSWSPTDLSRDGATVLLSHYLSSTRSELWAFRSSTGEKQRLSPAGEVSVSGGALGPDGTWALAASDHESEFKQLYRVDLASGAWTSLTPGLTWGVDGFALAPDGKTAAVVVNERGWDRLHLLDLKSGRLRPVSGLPEGQIGTMGFDLANPRRLGLTAGGPQSPLDAWVLDTKTGAAVRWTTSETGGLDPSTFVRPETVTWTTFDGRTLDALAYRPSGTGPFPVVISIHGGPEGQSRPSMNPLAQVLVQRGFVYLEPNVRGSTGYGKSFLAADNGRLREDAVKDIGTLLDWISRQPDMDAKRVAVRGGSYGGYMVLASLIHHGERLRAGIDIVGISDFVTFLESTRAYRQDLRRVEYGDERDPDMRAFLQSISPMARANEIRSQLLVMHGANDPRVPVQEAEQIVAKVRANGYRVGYLRAENEGHGFRKKQNRDLAEALQVMFLEQALELPR
jgi:dipeptidyl aminopeptidase/acylaminoacyl peptidase